MAWCFDTDDVDVTAVIDRAPQQRRAHRVAQVLRAAGLTKRFGSVLALDGVGLEVEPGQIVGFLGPNGAGKTTTMRAIMRLIALDAGEVTWDGRPVDPGVRQRFGYMPSERGMYPSMKVLDHLVYYARLGGMPAQQARSAAGGWLERLGLDGRAGDTIQSLSSGNQQRVQLALALLGDPELLVLDEPYSGLDPVAVKVLDEVLREQVERGAALLLSSHQLDLVADTCSAVVIVDQGRVVLRGDVAQIRAASPVRYLDLELAKPSSWRPDAAPDGDDRRRRITFEAGEDPNEVLTDARANADVLGWSFAPPDLSEVFTSAISGDAHPLGVTRA